MNALGSLNEDRGDVQTAIALYQAAAAAGNELAASNLARVSSSSPPDPRATA
jgi:hypothetical protein